MSQSRDTQNSPNAQNSTQNTTTEINNCFEILETVMSLLAPCSFGTPLYVYNETFNSSRRSSTPASTLNQHTIFKSNLESQSLLNDNTSPKQEGPNSKIMRK